MLLFGFKGLRADSIGSWIELTNVFLKHWGENKSLDLYLTNFYDLKIEEDEALLVFNRSFYNTYHDMPLEIQPTETVSMVFYGMSQCPELVLLLREIKSSSLRRSFEDAQEIEENIRASRRIREQVCFENLHAYEQANCQYISDFEQEDNEYEANLEQ